MGLLTLGWVDQVDLVLVVLWRGLRGHVMDMVDLRGRGMVVCLLDGVWSLGRGFVGLWVMDLMLLVSTLRRRLDLMVPLEAPSALVRRALSVELARQGGGLLLGLIQQFRRGVVGLGLLHLMSLVEQLCRGMMRLDFLHLMEQLGGGMVGLPLTKPVNLVEELRGRVVRLHVVHLMGLVVEELRRRVMGLGLLHLMQHFVGGMTGLCLLHVVDHFSGRVEGLSLRLVHLVEHLGRRVVSLGLKTLAALVDAFSVVTRLACVGHLLR